MKVITTVILVGMAAWTVPTARALAAGDLIVAGPMVGHVSPSTAKIWMRLAEGVALSAEGVQGTRALTPVRYEDLGRGFTIVHFEGLDPAASVKIDLEATSESGATESDSVRFETAPRPSLTGRVVVGFGSCSKDALYGRVPTLAAMADEHPDVALFVGDNSYFVVGNGDWGTSGPTGDWNSPELMIARHMQTRNNPDLQRLIRGVPCYGIWDDHDYGPDNSDRDFELREESLIVFSQVWANPSYGSTSTSGIFSSFRRGPVEFFLMDDRYHKYVSNSAHPEVGNDEATIWGDEQLNWLLAGLKATTAPVKIIANGTQILSETERGEGHFQEAPAEREKLLSFLEVNRIGGVIILSGDRHYSEVMRLKRGDGPDILEFTSSPLQQDKNIGPLRVRHETQLWGLNGNSYGLVTIDIPSEGEGTIRLEARDENNHVPIVGGRRRATTWELRKLQYD